VASAAVSAAEFVIETLNGNSILSVIEGVVPFGTAFGTCPIKPLHRELCSSKARSAPSRSPRCENARRFGRRAWTTAAQPRRCRRSGRRRTPRPTRSFHANYSSPGRPASRLWRRWRRRWKKPWAAPAIPARVTTPFPAASPCSPQLERINPDATPFPPDQRWKVKVSPASLAAFNLAAYLKALLGKDAGLFRVIAFVFTAEPIVSSNIKPVMDEAKNWVEQGGKALPGRYAGAALPADMVCTALIYEFEVPAHGEPARQRKPSEHNGQQHLRARPDSFSALGADMVRISISASRKVLALVWFIGAGISFLVLYLITTFGGSERVESLWDWYLPAVTPNLSLIRGGDVQ